MTPIEVIFWSGEHRLFGLLHLPDKPRPPVIIGSHGLFGTADSAKQVALAKACVNAELGYFRFDHRGCGRSRGDFLRVTNLSGRVQDMLAAIDTITSRKDTATDFGIFGSSFGGSISIKVFGLRPSTALVLYAAPVRSTDIDPGRAQPPDKAALALSRSQGLRFDVAVEMTVLRDVLVFHGATDEVVPYQHAIEIITAATEPKKLITLPKGDHRMTDPVHQQLFITETIRWLRDRLGV